MSPIYVQRTVRVAEKVVLISTLVAFTITVLALESSSGAFEANPVVRSIVHGFGWTVAGCVAIATIIGTFMLYRRINNVAPRTVFIGSILIIAISVGDMVNNLVFGTHLNLIRAVRLETAIPICVTTLTTVVMYGSVETLER